MNKKNVIITGGSRGYGYGIAKILTEKNYNVIITGRNKDSLEKAAVELECSFFRADITLTNDWDNLIDFASNKFNSIDILINNAGTGQSIQNIDKQNDEDIIKSININLIGAILGCKKVIPFMKKQKDGIIINISSVCAREAWPGWSVYSAAKAGLNQFSNCLYTELREYGIRVTILMPSWGKTSFLKAANLEQRDKALDEKVIQPEDLGKTVAYICDLPAHLNIQDITVWPLVQEVIPI